MTKRLDPVVRILTKARDLIARPGGWHQGEYRTRTKGTVAYCAIGAFDKATEKTANWSAAQTALRLITESLPKGHRMVTHYNDSPRRTQAQVVGLFNRAIKKASSK